MTASETCMEQLVVCVAQVIFLPILHTQIGPVLQFIPQILKWIWVNMLDWPISAGFLALTVVKEWKMLCYFIIHSYAQFTVNTNDDVCYQQHDLHRREASYLTFQP